MRKIIALILLIVVSYTMLCTTALSATDPRYTKEAMTLNSLGLFSGTGVDSKGNPVFELDRPATRIEAIVILIQLIGKQDEALSTTAANPFTDVPGWAEKYAAYAYENGISGGIGGNKFGSADKVTQNQFITFILRALGYSDKEGDFSYAKAYEKAEEIGLISKGLPADKESPFLRDDCVKISFDALGMHKKDSGLRLIDSLAADGSVSRQKAEQAGFDIIDHVDIKMTWNQEDKRYEASLSEIRKHIPEAAWVSYDMSAESFAYSSDEELLQNCAAVRINAVNGITTSSVKDIWVYEQ